MSFSKRSGNLTARVWVFIAFWALFAARGDGLLFAQGARPVQAAPGASASTPAPIRSEVEGGNASAWPDRVVVLDDLTDVGDLWKKLAGPYLLLQKAAGSPIPGGAEASAASRDYVIDSVKLEGRVEGLRARVAISIHCSLLAPGPVWVPIRLDDQVVLRAREGEHELALQPGAGKRWEARLEGEGEHLIRVELLADVRVDAERKSLALAIPEAPSTSFSLTLPHEVFDADLGAGEAIGQEKLPDGKGVRLFAHTKPRSPLVIGWSEEEGADARVAPLLAARVEMSIDVDSERITTRSKWVIRCVRGVCRSLQFRLDDDEELSPLQLNDQSLASGIEQVKGGSLLNIPLSEPMRQGDSRPIVLMTRRPLPAGAGRVLVFSGHPLTNAGEQSGMIAVTQSPNLWVGLESAEGLRRIDPRDLPSALLAQTGTSIALQFLDQPFRLALGIKDAPPLYKADSTTKLTLDADVVRNETTIDVQRVHGRLFEIEIGVAPELRLVSAGPPELIESPAPPPQERGAAPSPAQSEQILKLRLTALGRDQKSLSIKLVGRQDASNSGEARLGLFTPRGAVSTSAAFELYAGRDLTIESLDETLFDDSLRETPAMNVKLETRLANVFGGAATPSLRLRSNRNPSLLKVRLQRHPLAVAHETRVSARVDRLGVDLRQESTVQVRYGAIRSLVVNVPPKVSSRWEAMIKERLPREDLGPAKNGGRRFRLTFDRPISDVVTLRFEYRLPMGRSLEPGTPTPIQIPWIEIEEGTSSGCTMEVSSDPDVKAAADDPSWTRADDDGGDRPNAAELRRRLIPGATAPHGLSVSAELVESVALPRLIASRALIAATLGFENDLRIHAWYTLDAHSSSVALTLPEGARWIRARVDGRIIEEILADDDGASFRFSLPPGTAGRPVLVEIEYQCASDAVRRPWEAPKLLDGADVLQTFWRVQVPWNAALIGVPAGWADENQWYWDLYVWKRRPVASMDRLIAWVSEPTSAAAVATDETFPDRDDAHAYLFGRAGPPGALGAWVVSRAWIIVVCSGLVLALGFAVVFSGLGARAVWGGAAAVGLLSAMFLHPSTIALFLQSAVCGVVLTLLGFAINRAVRREPESGSTARPGGRLSGVGYDSSQRSAFGVGSDDSTAVRLRAPSTMDYLSPPPDATDPEESRSSSLSGGRANP